jgi:hypothetical protein
MVRAILKEELQEIDALVERILANGWIDNAPIWFTMSVKG